MNLAFSGNTLLLIVGIIILGVIALTLFLRSYLKSKTNSDLSEKYKDHEWASPLTARNKYPDVNPFNWNRPVWLFGAAASVLLAIMAFSWTQFEEQVYIPENALAFDEEIEMEPPRTAEPPPPPPPPPPPVIEEVPEEEIIEEEEPEFQDQSVEEETEIVEEVPVVEEAPPPPPPPPPPEPEVEEIFKIVEQNPRFPGCENESGGNKEKKACSDGKLLKYLYSNIKYPAIAKENGVEGKVYISFVVEKDGSITDTKLLRDIGAGCGDEALRVVKMMNNLPEKWTPGKQRGRSVRVQYNLPVQFELQ